MKTRAMVHAAVVLALLGTPPERAAGMSLNPAPVVDGLTVSPNPPPAGGAATVTCAAHDDGTVASVVITVSGGSLDGGGTSAQLPVTPAPSVTGSVGWTLPPAPAALTVTCAVTDGGGDFGAAPVTTSSTIPVTSEAMAPPPVVDSTSGPAAPILAESTVALAVVAHDPAGAALAYAWSTSAGTIRPVEDGTCAASACATLAAPAAAGTVTVTVSVTSASGTSPVTATIPVDVALALGQGALGAPLPGPHRVARGPQGNYYVVDGRGGFEILSARGERIAALPLPDAGLAVAAGGGDLAFVSTLHGRILSVDTAAARVVGSLDVGYATGPMGMAFDAAAGLLWLAERDAAQLRAIRLDGSTAFVARSAGGAPLAGATDVALDEASGLVWVALDYNPGGSVAHAFSRADGSWVRSAIPGGTSAGKVARAGGVAVDATGRVFVSDAYSGQVQVASAAGAPLGAIGSFGAGPGQLRQPAGLLALPGGDLLVANSDAGRLERYGKSAVPPAAACPGDSDCDGMPDAWEVLYALDPTRAADALLDPDGDGLTSLQESRHGTSPGSPDTDGDGSSDGAEVLAGTDPLADDLGVVLTTSDPRPSGPGLLRWSSSTATTGGLAGSCSASWTQTAGPAVTLRGADGFTPTFIARTAARYAFEGVATCGGRASAPVTVTAEVVDVAPRPDPGRPQVVKPDGPFVLDGSASSDANGDPFTLLWEQTLGPPLVAASTGPELQVQARAPAYLAFQLTASQAAGRPEGRAEVGVVVVDSVTPTALAVSPVAGHAGDTVTLDATASFLPVAGATFAWQQVEGAAVTLQGDGTATPSFVPPGAGRYRFEARVLDAGVPSAPATVDVYVASAGTALPVATVRPVAAGAAVGQPLTLDGAASAGGALAYRWRQVSGPAAGLTDDDRAIATVVPFGAGSHVFELTVQEGDALGVPARVRFEAREPGRTVPTAGASPVQLNRGKWMLDGRASAPRPLRYRWTQVGGPWVALDRADSAAPTFRPRQAGTYVFELEVEDGAGVRSAPATVTITAAEVTP
jgi:K319-like protein/thrombospondin type 3 repeat protein